MFIHHMNRHAPSVRLWLMLSVFLRLAGVNAAIYRVYYSMRKQTHFVWTSFRTLNLCI